MMKKWNEQNEQNEHKMNYDVEKKGVHNNIQIYKDQIFKDKLFNF